MTIQERRLSFATCWFALIICVLLLSGCQTTQLPSPSDTSAICSALIGPIKYNSGNKASRRFAADLLALDLKQRNQVGQALHCPAYR
jgi:hypothetical protein